MQEHHASGPNASLNNRLVASKATLAQNDVIPDMALLFSTPGACAPPILASTAVVSNDKTMSPSRVEKQSCRHECQWQD